MGPQSAGEGAIERGADAEHRVHQPEGRRGEDYFCGQPGRVPRRCRPPRALGRRRSTGIEAAGLEADVGDPQYDECDYILFDCPPSMGLLTLNALSAATEVIIPVQAKVLALNGVANLRRIIGVIRERLNPQLEVTGILLCMTDSRTNLSREVEASARKHFGPLVFRSTIRENVRVAESPSHFLPITRYAGSNPAAEDYRNFTREVLAQETKGQETEHGSEAAGGATAGGAAQLQESA